MANKNIQMKDRNGNNWDNLFPISLTGNIFNEQGETIDQVLNNVKDNVNEIVETKVTEKDTLIYYMDFSLKYSSKCAFVVAGGKTILIDFGDRNHSTEAVQKIRNLGFTSIDIGIISHYHLDHSGGLQNFIDSGLINSNTVMYLPPTPDWQRMINIGSGGSSDGNAWRSEEQTVFNALNLINVQYILPNEKNWVTLGEDSALRFHNTLPNYFEAYYTDLTRDHVDSDGVYYNNFSMVTEIRNGNKHFVFTGDLGLQAQRQLRNTFDDPIYFYDVEHHGLNFAYDKDFFKQINPKYVGIQNANTNFPYFSRGTYGYLKSMGADVYITGVNGDILFHDHVEGMEIKTTRKNGSAKTGQLQNYSLTGGYTVIPKGTHLDSLTEAGIYIARTMSDVNGISGLPQNQNESVQSSFKLVVETYHDSSRRRQTLYENSGRGYIWYRVFSTNNQWNPWFRLMRTIDLSPEEQPNGVGKMMEQGTNLNTITTLGKHSAPTNIVAQSIVNKPAEVQVSFTVEVYPLHASDRFYQILRTTNPDTDEYTRVFGASGFQPWNKVQKTRVNI